MRRALCMIDPTVEEVGLRRMPVAVAVASLTAVARAARGHDGGRCGGGDTGREYRAWLVGWSYAPETVKNMLAIAGDLGPMDGQPRRCTRPGGSVRDRGVPLAECYACRACEVLDPLLDYQKCEGVLAESPAPASPVEVR